MWIHRFEMIVDLVWDLQLWIVFWLEHVDGGDDTGCC